MIKLLIGGSPCTHWSIAQKNNRETEPEGLGWELFKNYLVAKEKFKPDFFLYENNKSAAQPIKDQIAKELGVDLMYINSALVSAQNRQRFYAFNWQVEQPEDRGIVLRDILETSADEITYELNAEAIPINPIKSGKSRTVTAGYANKGVKHILDSNASPNPNKQTWDSVAEPIRIGDIGSTSQAHRVYSCDGKSVTLSANGGGQGGKTGLYTVPFDVEALSADYYHGNDGGQLFGKIECENTSNNKGQPAQVTRIYNTTHKSVCLDGDSRKYIVDKVKNGKFVVGANKTAPIYEVKDGFITIKDKQYPIKLKDGYYIIRKLTPIECERLQTLPDNYTAAVSNSQRYKGLGNGWTAEVIIHILNGALKDVPRDEEIIVLSMYDGIGTGRYCLDKMGFTNIKYYAYEIDKYAKQIATSNYPDIIQCGDAFDLRHPDWTIGY